MRQLNAQDRRLQLGEARRVADPIEGLLVARPVEAELTHALGELGVIRRDRSGIPERAEVLRRVEAERGCGSERAGTPVRATRSGSLRRVLQDWQAKRFGLGDRSEMREHGD